MDAMDTDEALGPSEDPSDGSDTTPPEPRPKAPPINNRFMFVDVAARRAKQLRRGASPRLADDPDAPVAPNRPDPHKAERVAMEEVRRGLVLYEVVFPNSVDE